MDISSQIQSWKISWVGAAGALGFILGCGQSTSTISSVDPSSTRCNTGAAEIMIGDGFMKTLCGCTATTEADGTTFPAPGNLTCHLAANNTTVFFYYLETRLRHQVVSTGATPFLSSPLSDPDSGYPIRVHPVTLTQANTVYSFKDIFSGMSGQIFVP